MIVTEEEAKTKRCQESYGPPLTDDGRTIAMSSGFGGAHQMATSPMFCIGSACMAWRWVRERNWANNRTYGARTEDFLGYCGKAGKP